MNKENQPLVGIAVPVYNGGKYLRECLESILNQSYTNWICYITDNASTDDSNAIATEFAEKDERFKVFRNQETIIAYKNWNVSLGRFADVPVKYVKFECADDWMFPNCLEDMVALHEKYDNLGVVYGYRMQGTKIDCDGLDIYDGEVFEGKDIILKNLKQGTYIYGDLGSALFRKETIASIAPDLHFMNENSIHCDIEMNDDVVLRSKVGFVYKVLMYYRRHEGQILSFAERYNTMLFEFERRIYLMMQQFPDDKELPLLYKQWREEYALFLAKCKRKKQTDIIEWHEKYLERPITKQELNYARRQAINNSISSIKSACAHIVSLLNYSLPSK